MVRKPAYKLTPGSCAAYCNCQMAYGRRVNVIPLDFLEDGSACATCGASWESFEHYVDVDMEA